MKVFNLITNSMFGLACLGMAIPHCSAMDQSQVTHVAQSFQIADVAMMNGQLSGKVVNTQGEIQAGVVISASLQGNIVSQVTSDESGAFVISNLETGLHQLQAGETNSTVRLWNGAAPPSAKSNVLLVTGTTERGQILSNRLFGMRTLTTTVVVTGAIIGGVIIANDDDDTPASP